MLEIAKNDSNFDSSDIIQDFCEKTFGNDQNLSYEIVKNKVDVCIFELLFFKKDQLLRKQPIQLLIDPNISNLPIENILDIFKAKTNKNSEIFKINQFCYRIASIECINFQNEPDLD